MNKRIATIISAVLLGTVFVFMFCFSVLFPRTTVSDNSTLKEKPTLSADALLSGEYFSDLTAWFTDTVCMRDSFVDINSIFRSLFGFTPEEQIFIRDDLTFAPDPDVTDEPIWTPEFPDIGNEQTGEDISVENTTAPIPPDSATGEDTGISPPDNSAGEDSTATPPETTTKPIPPETTLEEITQAPVPEEIVNSLVILGNRALEIYYGNPAGAIKFANALNAFADKVGDGVNVYSMVIPKACAYYLQDSKTYGKYAGKTLEDLEVFRNNYDSNVIEVNIYDTLYAHKNENIYFRTDHHWTALGAYYAAEKFAEVAGVDFVPLSSYTRTERPGFVGSLYKYTNNSATLLNNPDTLETYVPSAGYRAVFYNTKLAGGFERNNLFWGVPDQYRSSWYMTFLGGDNYAVQINSDVCNNGRKLLIVKDSYGNTLPSYFINSFEEIYVVDARYFEVGLSSLVESKGITDVLFAESQHSAVSAYSNNIIALTK